MFASSTWLVTQSRTRHNVLRSSFSRTEPQNYSALKNSKTVILTKSEYDVFGDGIAVIVAGPGHSPGHQVLRSRPARQWKRF